MNARRAVGWTCVVALAALLAGCGSVGNSAKRYRAEHMLWSAEHEETKARLNDQKPDSTTLLKLRESYLKVSESIQPPYVKGSSPKDRAMNQEIAHVIGNAELQAARLAVEANRPDLALQRMMQVAALAGEDTLLRRQADFFRLATLRQYKRTSEAVALMKEMIRVYEPLPPKKPGEEDPVLAIPETIVRMHREAGDERGANQALAEALAYYRGLLRRQWPPELLAQIYARLVRSELEQGNWTEGMRDLETLKRLATSTPELKRLEPEVRYSEARLLAMRAGKGGDTMPAIKLLDAVAKDFRGTPWAAHALFDGAVLYEGKGNLQEALQRYRIVSTEYARQEDIAPMATFRRAMLEERTGDWEKSKNLLESIPVRYPESRAAIEAPMAIVARYKRLGLKDSEEGALRKAIITYRDLIARDTTSNYCAVYRWAITRSHLQLGEWQAALAVVDEMARRDTGHPFAAQALIEGAQIAEGHNQPSRAKFYLEKFLTSYPESPLAGAVKKELKSLAKPGGAG